MKISDCMSRDVVLVDPGETLVTVAQLMSDRDIGALLVADGNRLVGIITDRDIAIRAVACGKGPDTPVQDIMTIDVACCNPEDDVADVLEKMADTKVRRLPVVDQVNALAGIVSLGDIARYHRLEDRTAMTLGRISRPGGQHSQASHVPAQSKPAMADGRLRSD